MDVHNLEYNFGHSVIREFNQQAVYRAAAAEPFSGNVGLVDASDKLISLISTGKQAGISGAVLIIL